MGRSVDAAIKARLLNGGVADEHIDELAQDVVSEADGVTSWPEVAALADEFIESYRAIGQLRAAGVDAGEAAFAVAGFADLTDMFGDEWPMQGRAEDYLRHRAGRLSGDDDD